MLYDMVRTFSLTKHRLVFSEYFTRHRFLVLFLFLLVTLIIYPYTEGNGFGLYAFRVLACLVIALCVYAIRLGRGLAVVGILLAIPAMVQHVLNPRVTAGFFPVANLVLSFTFDVWVVVSIFRRVFSNVRITSETIFGALCIYLLNGMSFASVYGLISDLQPSAFFLDPAVNRHAIPDRFDFIFYSFGMMTQLGAAGITAVTDQARSLSVIEAILGQLYLAVLISRLVAAYRINPPAANS
jgi:hypothetical protein